MYIYSQKVDIYNSKLSCKPILIREYSIEYSTTTTTTTKQNVERNNNNKKNAKQKRVSYVLLLSLFPLHF